MKVLVVDGGGRGHAIVRKIHEQNPEVELYATPGNPGMAEYATRVPIETTDIDGLTRFAQGAQMDLTIVGAVESLRTDIGWWFPNRGLKFFGPSAACSRVVWGGDWAREFTRRTSPTPSKSVTVVTDGKHALYLDSTSEQDRRIVAHLLYFIKVETTVPYSGVFSLTPDRECDCFFAEETIAFLPFNLLEVFVAVCEQRLGDIPGSVSLSRGS